MDDHINAPPGWTLMAKHERVSESVVAIHESHITPMIQVTRHYRLPDGSGYITQDYEYGKSFPSPGYDRDVPAIMAMLGMLWRAFLFLWGRAAQRQNKPVHWEADDASDE